MMEITSSLWELQKAIYQRLSSDPTIQSMNLKVYDEVKEDAHLPYITLGEETVNEFGAKDFIGEDVTTLLHTWSDYDGKKQTKEIIDAILRALSRTPLTLTGYVIEDLKRENINVIREDGLYHGLLRLRLRIKPI